MGSDRDKTLARSLGEFFGHIWHGGVKGNASPNKKTLRREVEQHSEPAPGGKVTLRRITTEEIEYEPDNSSHSG